MCRLNTLIEFIIIIWQAHGLVGVENVWASSALPVCSLRTEGNFLLAQLLELWHATLPPPLPSAWRPCAGTACKN